MPAFGAFGSADTGSNGAGPGYPSGITAGQKLSMWVLDTPAPAVPNAISGWNQVAQIALTGSLTLTVFETTAVGTESGTLTVSVPGATATWAQIARLTKDSAKVWATVVGVGATDLVSGTSVSVAFGSDPGVIAGDLIWVHLTYPLQLSGCSAEALSQSGVTFGTMVERRDTGVSLGGGMRSVVAEFPVSLGASGGNPTFTATISSAAIAAALFIRFREIDNVVDADLSASVPQPGVSADIETIVSADVSASVPQPGVSATVSATAFGGKIAQPSATAGETAGALPSEGRITGVIDHG